MVSKFIQLMNRNKCWPAIWRRTTFKVWQGSNPALKDLQLALLPFSHSGDGDCNHCLTHNSPARPVIVKWKRIDSFMIDFSLYVSCTGGSCWHFSETKFKMLFGLYFCFGFDSSAVIYPNSFKRSTVCKLFDVAHGMVVLYWEKKIVCLQGVCHMWQENLCQERFRQIHSIFWRG